MNHLVARKMLRRSEAPVWFLHRSGAPNWADAQSRCDRRHRIAAMGGR